MILNTLNKFLSISISVVLVAWFVFQAITTNVYYKGRFDDKQKDYASSISAYKSIYYKGMNTFNNAGLSYALLIARNYLKVDSLELAELYFKKSLCDLPSCRQCYFEYANFLFKQGRYEEAIVYSKTAYKFNNSFIFLINLSAKLALNTGDVELAKFYVDRLDEVATRTSIPAYLDMVTRREKELYNILNDIPFNKEGL